MNKIMYEQNVLQTVIDNIPELIFYKDKNLKYMGMNKHCENFYIERGVTNVIGRSDSELPLEPTFIEACIKNDNIVKDSKASISFEERAQLPDSEDYQILETIKTPIIDEMGEFQGLVGVVRDITEQKKLEEKLRYLSYTDSLTGLYNRSYFDEIMMQLNDENCFPIGIVTGDVNGLKIVNDTLGHLEGDKLIQMISNTLKEACDRSGYVFRWGGDEFITVLPNASNLDCEAFINKVNELCKKEKDDVLKLSIAQGFALFNKGNTIDTVLRESEDNAYKDKISSEKSVKRSMFMKIMNNLNLKNVETAEHIERVTELSVKMGEALGLEHTKINELKLAAQLHDIGKVGVPEAILLKQAALTADEFEIMKTHAEKGYRLALLIPEYSHVARAILTHHERFDGKGYPLGLIGEEIPLFARVISLVEAFDVMTHHQVYKKAVSKEAALKEIKCCAGTQFDPQIVAVFCEMMKA